MSNFRSIDRETGFLLPPSVDEWLPQKHLARFVVEVIDGLDLRAMSGSYRGSVSGALYRVWTDLVSTLSGHSEKAVLEQCERAEDEAKKIYEKAIALDLPPAIKSLVTQQFAGLKENHDRIRKLRDELSA